MDWLFEVRLWYAARLKGQDYISYAKGETEKLDGTIRSDATLNSREMKFDDWRTRYDDHPHTEGWKENVYRSQDQKQAQSQVVNIILQVLGDDEMKRLN